MEIEVKIQGFATDPIAKQVILVLKDVASEAMIPIWLSTEPAVAIAREIEHGDSWRPTMEDLNFNLIRVLGGRLERVVISDLKQDTFFATLWLRIGVDSVVIDARASQAIALALRADCPLYVSEEVMNSAAITPSGRIERLTEDEFRQWLERLDGEDLGPYKM